MRSVLSRLPLGSGGVPMELQGLAARIRVSSPRVDMREVVRAYAYAEAAHDGQYRKSGEAYITHPVAVAT
ncbi:MAG: guanosine-3',5'-bis(diphosphate) 3'-pyrophosphohydrolase, partial [Glaciecola sp.]